MRFMEFTSHFDKQGLKEMNTTAENANTSNFNEVKITWLMFTGSQDFYLGVYAG